MAGWRDGGMAGWRDGDFAGYTDIHVDLRFGCDPATGNVVGQGDCIARDANNGYEQLFIGTSVPVEVPEPGVLWMMGASMLGLALVLRRKN